MIAGIDTTRLKVFREVADRGSFTVAANLLHISQPAVSQHVAKLEQELGFPLLERSSRKVRLTAAGEVFLRHVDTLLTGLDDARRELTALARSDTGRIRIAVFPSAVATFVPVAVGAFRRAYPGVNVSLWEGDPPAALPRLLAGDVDMAVVYDYPMTGTPIDPRLVAEAIGRDRMAVAVRTDHALATARMPITLRSLAREQWVAPGPSMCRDALRESCRRAGFMPRVVSETNDYQAMLGLVAAEVGTAVIPELVALLPRPRGVVLRPLVGTPLERVVSVVSRRGAQVPPAMAAMRAFLGETLARKVAEGMIESLDDGPCEA